jgi:hypothetical protein
MMVEGTKWGRLALEAAVIISSILLAVAISQAYSRWQDSKLRLASLSASQWDNSVSTWQKTGATTASLRTGGAYLVASDAVDVDNEKTALITYWIWPEGVDNQEVYRCVDIVASVDFEHAAQKCWKVLRARGRS